VRRFSLQKDGQIVTGKGADCVSLFQDIVGQEAEAIIRIRRVSESLEAYRPAVLKRPKPKKSVSFVNAEATASIPVCSDQKMNKNSFEQFSILKRLHRWLT